MKKLQTLQAKNLKEAMDDLETKHKVESEQSTMSVHEVYIFSPLLPFFLIHTHLFPSSSLSLSSLLPSPFSLSFIFPLSHHFLEFLSPLSLFLYLISLSLTLILSLFHHSLLSSSTLSRLPHVLQVKSGILSTLAERVDRLAFLCPSVWNSSMWT